MKRVVVSSKAEKATRHGGRTGLYLTLECGHHEFAKGKRVAPAVYECGDCKEPLPAPGAFFGCGRDVIVKRLIAIGRAHLMPWRDFVVAVTENGRSCSRLVDVVEAARGLIRPEIDFGLVDLAVTCLKEAALEKRYGQQEAHEATLRFVELTTYYELR